jgi:hypothetical protein
MRAIRHAAFGGGNAYREIAMCFGLAAVYVAGGILVLGTVLNSARKRATLSLT